MVTADCLPDAWEKAVLDNGFEIKTQYDKAGNPPSKRNREKGVRSIFLFQWPPAPTANEPKNPLRPPQLKKRPHRSHALLTL